MARCPLCGQIMGEIGTAHLKKHGISRQQFYEAYPQLKSQTAPSFAVERKGYSGKPWQDNYKKRR